MKKSQLIFLTRFTAFIICLLVKQTVFAQPVLWNNATTSTNWNTATNWLPATSSWTTTSVATFTDAATRNIGINFSAGPLSIQGIAVNRSTTTPAQNITIANASLLTAGSLILNGDAAGNILNVSDGTLTLKKSTTAGFASMNVVLVKAVSNIYANRGGVIIESDISGAGKALTVKTDAGGSVELKGQNSYTGVTTIAGGAGASVMTLRLNRTGGATLPAASEVNCMIKGHLRVLTNQTLKDVRVFPQGRLIVENGATLTITSRLQTYPGGVSVVGTGRIVYAPGASLLYHDSYSGASTSSAEFPETNGPTNIMISNIGTLPAVMLHASRTISGFIAPGKCFVLGSNNFTASQVANASAPIVTNGTGLLYLTNVGSTVKNFPISASITTIDQCNAVTITNGGGLTYGVKVETGVSPVLTGSSTAVNRTWHIKPSATPPSAVKISFSYLPEHGNAGFSSTATVNVLQYTTGWTPVAYDLAQVYPLPFYVSTMSGSGVARFAVQNTPVMFAPAPSGKSGYTPIAAGDFKLTILQPVAVTNKVQLKIKTEKVEKIQLAIYDVTGRQLIRSHYTILKGDNLLHLQTADLPKGIYSVTATNNAGLVKTVHFIQ